MAPKLLRQTAQERAVNPKNRTAHGYSISPCNSKMGEIPSVSVPSGVTCPDDQPCKKDCYAKHIEQRHPATLACYQDNLTAMKQDGGYDGLVRDVCAYVDLYACKKFRWNVAGDIFSPDYLRAICTVADRCPDCRFFLFTKAYSQIANMDINGIVKPDNLVIILSVWGDYRPSAELAKSYPLAYYQDRKKSYDIPGDAHVCDSKHVKCDKCGKCLRLKPGQMVVFNQH